MQFDDVWRVPQHDFFQELNLLGRLWLFHLCWEATQLMEMDGKTVHLSNIVWQLVGFLNLAILMRQLQAGYQDFVTNCYQLLPINHWLIWLIWLIWQDHWSTASVHSENPSPRAAWAARACDRSDGLLGLILGTSATSACDTRCFVLQVLDLDFQGHFNLNIHVETYQLSPKVCLQVLQDMKLINMIYK